MGLQVYLEYVKYHVLRDLHFQGNGHFEFVQKVGGVIMLEISPEYTNSHDFVSRVLRRR